MQDIYGDWARASEVEEAGCVLVRPDGYVAWRSAALPGDPTGALAGAMGSILGFQSLGAAGARQANAPDGPLIRSALHGAS